MSFQRRLILLVTGLVALAVGLTTLALAWGAHGALRDRMETDARLSAALLARSAERTREIPRAVEEMLGARLLSEATLTAHLVALAEASKQSPKAIADRLKTIAESGGPDEMWITDNRGRAYLHNIPGPDLVFGSDHEAQPREAPFYGLLSRAPATVVAEAYGDGGRLMKFAGVSGVDRPRIVQVGANLRALSELSRQFGPAALIEAVSRNEGVEAAWLLGGDLSVQAGAKPLPAAALEEAKAVLGTRDLRTLYAGGSLLALAPVADGGGVAVVALSGGDAGALVGSHLLTGLVLGLLVLAAGIVATVRFSRLQMAPIERLSEAVAEAEAGRFNPFRLNEAMERSDEFGRLARVFRGMAMEAAAREETLDAQLLMRTVELEGKTERLGAAETLIEEEQRAARAVQMNLLPPMPSGRDSQLFGALLPIQAVSGDFYDIVELDERHLVLVIAGVSGGGVPAAFLMLLVRGAIREMIRPGVGPGAILSGANDSLCGQSPFDGFATAFIAIYDRETGLVRHATAGHRPPFRVAADGAVERLSDAGGPALGVRKGVAYGEASLVLRQEDTVFLHTESIVKAVNANREPFGEERLAATLQQGRNFAVRDRAELVVRAVEAHAGVEGIPGDIACLVLRRLHPSAELPAADAAAVASPAPTEDAPA
ncbi:SpoIIE family protein phosphatase [Azospirillum sp. SYSU D00513]|uniref:PP2C family protein-serine/threonine phosphatase n=1 Tax=Azospirillum sp. SYSU D00513 TaxID=2812561 RepID=UPI001A9631ED|nr:SpoIIE family protein phosphatase [Azospirillum sp. SYSU D00513]